MLCEFLTTQRDAIIVRARETGLARSRGLASQVECLNGPPLFLAQLAKILRLETATTSSSDASGEAAASGAGDPLALGFSISQVIASYVDTCQAIIAIASEQDARLTVEEFLRLDRCLDDSIAAALTRTHLRLRAMRNVEPT